MSAANVVQRTSAGLPSRFESAALPIAAAADMAAIDGPAAPAATVLSTLANTISGTASASASGISSNCSNSSSSTHNIGSGNTNTATTTTTTTTTTTRPPAIAHLDLLGPKRLRIDDHREGRTAKIRQTSFTKSMEPPVLSFYGSTPVPLPSRFRHVKKRLISGREEELKASWVRLLDELKREIRHIEDNGSGLIPSIDFADIEDAAKVEPFNASLKRYGIGVVKGVVPSADASAWVEETKDYLRTKHDYKAPPAQDPTCFDFFWTPAQVRSRAHAHVLQAQRFAMSLWDTGDDDRLATRFPIAYADRIRIESISDGNLTVNGNMIPASPEDSLIAAAAKKSSVQIAQVDNGSLERWEQDGYGRAGLYDQIFKGEWEKWNPWDPAGRINATPDLYNGAGACSMMRLFQGILALTVVEPGMIRLLPSPKLSTTYFLLRPFFSPKQAAPEAGDDRAKWDAYLDASNWELDKEPSTVIHGAVPGHAQRVSNVFHPHLELERSLIAPPTLQPGDYIIWHPDQAYQFSNTEHGGSTAATSSGMSSTSMLVYTPAAPLTQTNALFLARQRKAFLRGHPGPDFDSTGTGLGSEAPHTGRLGENEIREVGGEEGLQAMGLAPWNLGKSVTMVKSSTPSSSDSKDRDSEDGGERSLTPVTHAEVEVLKMANVILFPERYEFYMPTRAPSRASSPMPSKDKDKERDKETKNGSE